MANKKHELQQTRGAFQVVGVVTGTMKDKFYVDTTTKKGKPFRAINFGVEFENGKTMYVALNGMEQEKVYFNRRTESGTTEMKDVPWSQRLTFDEEGFRLLGVGVGLEKGEDGKNIKKTLTPFDACDYIGEHLTDGMPIFVKGQIEYSTYKTNNQTKRSVKFIPQQISLMSKEIELDSLDYEVQADFKQRIVFNGIDKVDGDFKLQAKIVNYGSIEDAEFVVKDSSLANIFKKNLKPYNAIDVHGRIEVSEDVSQVTVEDDTWGEASKMDVVNSPTKRELVITGATKSTLDTMLYTEESVMKAVKALTQEQQAQVEWGNQANVNEEDDEW